MILLNKIQIELNSGVETQKQRIALEELKKGLIEDLASYPIQLEEDDSNEYIDDSQDDSEDLTPEEQELIIYQHLRNQNRLHEFADYKNSLRLAL